MAPEKTNNKEDIQTVLIKHPQSLILPNLKEDGQRTHGAGPGGVRLVSVAPSIHWVTGWMTGSHGTGSDLLWEKGHNGD